MNCDFEFWLIYVYCLQFHSSLIFANAPRTKPNSKGNFLKIVFENRSKHLGGTKIFAAEMILSTRLSKLAGSGLECLRGFVRLYQTITKSLYPTECSHFRPAGAPHLRTGSGGAWISFEKCQSNLDYIHLVVLNHVLFVLLFIGGTKN